jgi:hypothetical protein
MRSAEIESLVRNREGRLCARFYARPDGTLLTQNCPVGLRTKVRRLSRAAAAMLSAATAAMSPTFAMGQTGATSSPSTQSQRLESSLLLKVTDQTGAVISKAKVSLLDREKKSLYEGVTDPTGQVLISHLVPGAYSVIVTASGFTTYRLEAEVRASQTRKITMKIDVGATMGVIVVTGGPVETEPVRIPW